MRKVDILSPSNGNCFSEFIEFLLFNGTPRGLYFVVVEFQAGKKDELRDLEGEAICRKGK